MNSVGVKFKGKVWLYEGKAAWHFVSLPKRLSASIQKNFCFMKRGWGSLRVTVTVGKSTWKTSIFPDKRSGTYLLPLKAEARVKEKVTAGETRSFAIEIDV